MHPFLPGVVSVLHAARSRQVPPMPRGQLGGRGREFPPALCVRNDGGGR